MSEMIACTYHQGNAMEDQKEPESRISQANALLMNENEVCKWIMQDYQRVVTNQPSFNGLAKKKMIAVLGRMKSGKSTAACGLAIGAPNVDDRDTDDDKK